MISEPLGTCHETDTRDICGLLSYGGRPAFGMRGQLASDWPRKHQLVPLADGYALNAFTTSTKAVVASIGGGLLICSVIACSSANGIVGTKSLVERQSLASQLPAARLEVVLPARSAQSQNPPEHPRRSAAPPRRPPGTGNYSSCQTRNAHHGRDGNERLELGQGKRSFPKNRSAVAHVAALSSSSEEPLTWAATSEISFT